MPESVLIHGGGVAACCCASLLSNSGYRVSVDQPERAGSPVLMLNDQTQLLLRDVFGGESLLDGAVKITTRIVKWGQDSEAVVLPHSGLVISEKTLLNRLWPIVKVHPTCDDYADNWKVHCSRDSLPGVSQHEFGSRMASTHSVRLSRGASNPEACWVEATQSGWLFLIPCGVEAGSLISVGGMPEILLEESRLVASQVSEVGAATGRFPAYPRIVHPLGGRRWIACGSAAIGFDPIAGEGAGHAIRQGILASAVIRAAAKGAVEDELLAHYSNRMLSGFLRHLDESSRFYTADFGPWWKAELDIKGRALTAAKEDFARDKKSCYRLVGFELEKAGVE